METKYSKPKKSLGQNFLISESIIKKIIDSIDIDDNLAIVEIGPGRGALTSGLLSKAKKLVLIELDKELANILKEKYIDDKKVEIINDDVLEVNFEDILSKLLKECSKIIVVSNTPYYISSQILFLLFHNSQFIYETILMMQKEVVDKISAVPNTKAYSNLAVITKHYGDFEKITDVKKGAFFPQPKIDSVVFKIKFKKHIFNDLNVIKYEYFVRSCFQFKRKLLVNNLRNSKLYDWKLIEELLPKLNIHKNIRAEEMDHSFFWKLFIFLEFYTKESIYIISNAKCTLALDIKNRAANTIQEYHDLEGIYAPIFQIHDQIIMNFNVNETKILVLNDKLNIINNNIKKLISILHQKEIFKENIHIIIWKNIPIGSGLAGESSNVYFVFKIIFQYLKLDVKKYRDLLYSISSDSLFFENNQISYVSNYGKQIDPIKYFKEPKYKLIIHNNVGFNTKDAFRLFDTHYNNSSSQKKYQIKELVKFLEQGLIEDFYKYTYNNFDCLLENDVFYINLWKSLNKNQRKYKIILSGSGTSFILFPWTI